MASHRNDESDLRRGAILLLVAIAIVAMMGVMVLAIDGGLVQRQRRVAQLAADAAAKAGAIEILRLRPESVIASARSEASRNAFTNGVGGRVVTVTYPSTDATYGGSNFVQIDVRDTVRSIFAGFIGRARVPVNGHAIGGVTGTTQSCITSLSPDASPGILVDAGGQVAAVGCNVSVNSTSSTALCVTASEGGSLTAGGISIVGGYDSGCRGTVSPAALTGQSAVADPLALTGTILVTDTSGACNGGAYKLVTVVADTTLNPGIFCGGIKAAKSTSIARFNPGLYVIKGGGLSVGSWGSVIGTKATINNLNAPLANGGASKFAVIDFGSDANITWSAPTSGRVATIAMMSPTGQGVSGHLQQNQITSTANATITGSLWFPDQEMRLGSGGTLTINGGVVANDILFRSDSRVNVTGFGGGGGSYGVLKASIVK
jgi:hypothetical protein